MNNYQITNLEISTQVRHAMVTKGWSLRMCCEEFNQKHKRQIKGGSVEALNKDFLSRIRQNKFDIVSERVFLLCYFLNISLDLRDHKIKDTFNKEFTKLNQLVSKNPKIEKKLKSLLNNLIT